MEASARAKLDDLKAALAGDPEGAREVLRTLFPDGLTFSPATKEKRRAFEVARTAKVAAFKSTNDPTASLRNVTVEIPVSLAAVARAA